MFFGGQCQESSSNSFEIQSKSEKKKITPALDGDFLNKMASNYVPSEFHVH